MDEIGDFGFKSKTAVRENLRGSKKEFNKTEDDLKSLQSVGQIIGEVLRPLDNERCNCSFLFHIII
jgi:ATP-dependent 26S proteasome regulatory subunit